MSLVGTYNSCSIRGFQKDQFGYVNVNTLQPNIANGSSFGFTIESDNNNYAIISAIEANTIYFYCKNSDNIFVNVASNTGVRYTGVSIGTDNNANYTIVGTQALVSANTPGTCYMFERSGNTFTRSTLTNPYSQNNDRFGISVAISNNGNYCAVSAITQGNVYFYERTGNTWAHQSTINSVSPGPIKLNYDGSKIAIGQKNPTVEGNVAIYSRSISTWTLDQTLTANDGYANNQFGSFIDYTPNGNTLIIGDYGANVGNISAAGAAYIFEFDITTNSYIETAKLISDEPSSNGSMSFGGVSITDDANVVIIGQSTYSNNTGKSYIFNRNNISNLWQLINVYVGRDGNIAQFGYNVNITGSGSTALVGAYTINQGKTYQYNNFL